MSIDGLRVNLLDFSGLLTFENLEPTLRFGMRRKGNRKDQTGLGLLGFQSHFLAACDLGAFRSLSRSGR